MPNILKSPIDNRDWKSEDIHHYEMKLPDSLDYSSIMGRIRNQGNEPSCAAFSACDMKSYQERKDIGYEGFFEPTYIYNKRENKDTSGMYGRDLMKILSKFGALPQKDYILQSNNSWDNIAKNYKIKGYCQVNTVLGCKKALYINGPVIICVPMYNNSNKMWIKNKDDEKKNGHALLIVGYNDKDKTLKLRNSWGPEWNDGGHCDFPYEDWDKRFECWTTTDDTSLKITPTCNCLSFCCKFFGR